MWLAKASPVALGMGCEIDISATAIAENCLCEQALLFDRCQERGGADWRGVAVARRELIFGRTRGSSAS